MERADLIKRLAEKRFEHFRLLGLPPFKCKQLVTEKMPAWKQLSNDELERLVEHGEPEY